ncbi:MAG: copper homeostasis protein CutC [Bacteroidetes bacterium]|uniref:copper homeostasis protein CutC n=1 Tax=Phnomibacter sp. TaxID=2836217 RepID=UPI002FDD71CA|nr:copper homeostasis protein CutC [Bacteroidota bacterium]
MPAAVLEVCSFGIQTSLIAERVGAKRVELCDNPIEGGTTPSYGAIRQVREKLSIEVYPIIRPRSMNYYYDDDEFAMMLHDVRMCKELGCDGISVGVQLITGQVDTDRMKRLVEVAYPMGVTSNRVIDAAPDPYEALEALIEAGCERVLTSGQAATAPAGKEVLKKLVEQAAGRISIMPGAGVKSGNVKELLQYTGAYECHTSARIAWPNNVAYQNPQITDAGSMYVADEEELRKIIAAIV